MAQQIVCVVGGPRCLTNGIGRFLQRLGAGRHRCTPAPSGFNADWCLDGDANHAAARFLGANALGLLNPTRPSPTDAAARAALVDAIRAGAALAAPAPYLLCMGYLPAIAPEVRDALPPSEFDYVLVNMTRGRAARVASLRACYQREIDGGAAAGRPPRDGLAVPTAAQAGAYIDACDAARDAFLSFAQGRGWPVRTLDVDGLKAMAGAQKAAALAAVAAGLGLRDPGQADLDFIDPNNLTV